MTTKIGEHYDYNIRQWCIDSAVAANKKGSGSDRIVRDAERFYGFLFPDNGKITDIDKEKR